jgi:streptomycin 3"-adenylyltransferase
VERVVTAARYELRNDLVGVYLHGSLATGCFRRAGSDVDLLIVSRNSLDEISRRRLASAFLGIWRLRPITETIELHVIREDAARTFVHPMPYELVWDDKRAEDTEPRPGLDPDLAAHCAMTRARGVALVGPPPETVFGEVPWQHYVDSVLRDFDWNVADDHFIGNPTYGVLNACRVLEMLTHPGVVSNKEEGGRWGLGVVPAEHRAMVERALEVYTAAEEVAFGQPHHAALDRFRDWVQGEVGRLRPSPPGPR